MSLLVTKPYDPTDPVPWVGEAIRSAQQMQLQREKLAATERAQATQQQEQHLADQRRAFEFDRKMEYQRARDAVDDERAASAMALRTRQFEADNAPFSLTPGSTGGSALSGPVLPTSLSLPAPQLGAADAAALELSGIPGMSAISPAINAAAVIGNATNTPGKITDYGAADDPLGDSLTRAGKSAIGNLTPQSMAVSPDVEAAMKAAGIGIGSPVRLRLDDGSTIDRVWDDRTASDAVIASGAVNGVSAPLRGRYDLYSPGGASPLRGRSVLGFSPVPATASTDLPLPGQPVNAGNDPTGMVQRAIAGLQGLPNKTARPILASVVKQALTPTKPVKAERRNVDGVGLVEVAPDGTTRTLVPEVQKPDRRSIPGVGLVEVGADGTAKTLVPAVAKPGTDAEAKRVAAEAKAAASSAAAARREEATFLKDNKGKIPTLPWEGTDENGKVIYHDVNGSGEKIKLKDRAAYDTAMARWKQWDSIRQRINGVRVMPATSPTATPAPTASVEMVRVVGPDGKPGSIPASNLEKALARGYKRADVALTAAP